MIDYQRQMEIFNPDKFDIPVHVAGCGASGSWVVIMLAKLGVKNVHIWDFDKIEEHNIPNQGFMVADIGNYKATESMANALKFGNMNYTCHTESVTDSTILDGIVFMLTDTMSSRDSIFKGAIKYKPMCKLLIETRMGLDSWRCYTINPMSLSDVEKYEATLYKDEEAETSACGSSKSVVTTAMNIASMAVHQMLNWFNGKPINHEVIHDLGSNFTLATKWEDK